MDCRIPGFSCTAYRADYILKFPEQSVIEKAPGEGLYVAPAGSDTEAIYGKVGDVDDASVWYVDEEAAETEKVRVIDGSRCIRDDKTPKNSQS